MALNEFVEKYEKHFLIFPILISNRSPRKHKNGCQKVAILFYPQPFRKQLSKPIRVDRLLGYNKLIGREFQKASKSISDLRVSEYGNSKKVPMI